MESWSNHIHAVSQKCSVICTYSLLHHRLTYRKKIFQGENWGNCSTARYHVPNLCVLSVQAQWLVSVSGGRRQWDTQQHSGLSVELWGGGVWRHFWRGQRFYYPSAGEKQELEDERDRVPQTWLAVRPKFALSTTSEGKKLPLLTGYSRLVLLYVCDHF